MNDRQIDQDTSRSGEGAPKRRPFGELLAGIAVIAWAAISALAAEV